MTAFTDIPHGGGSSWSFAASLKAAREGEGPARNELCERYYATVQQMVHVSLSRDLRRKRPWIAALFSTGDVVQEVFKSVSRDLASFQGSTEREFLGYLSRLVRNRLIDAVRHHQAAFRDRRRVRRLIEGFEPASEGSGPGTGLVRKEELEAFQGVLSSFSERERRLLSERIEHRALFGSIAERLDYPSADAARKAFKVLQARLLLRLGAHTKERGQ